MFRVNSQNSQRNSVFYVILSIQMKTLFYSFFTPEKGPFFVVFFVWQ